VKAIRPFAPGNAARAPGAAIAVTATATAKTTADRHVTANQERCVVLTPRHTFRPGSSQLHHEPDRRIVNPGKPRRFIRTGYGRRTSVRAAGVGASSDPMNVPAAVVARPATRNSDCLPSRSDHAAVGEMTSAAPSRGLGDQRVRAVGIHRGGLFPAWTREPVAASKTIAFDVPPTSGCAAALATTRWRSWLAPVPSQCQGRSSGRLLGSS